jgi:RHS repeat-associated protein
MRINARPIPILTWFLKPALEPARGASHLLARLALVICLFLFAGSVSYGQITNVAADQQTPTPGVGHDYIQMLSETVDPSMGALSIRINVPTPKGRGPTLPFAFSYDSNGASYPRSDPTGVVRWVNNSGLLSQGGWAYSIPKRSYVDGVTNDGFGDRCNWTSNYMFQDPSGGRHALGLGTAVEHPANSGACLKTNVLAGGDTFYSATPVLVADRDGTVFDFNNSTLSATGGPSTLEFAPSIIEDRNGNKITIAGTGSQSFTVTDTVGRTLLTSTGFGTTGNTVSVSGLANPYTLTWGTITPNYVVGMSNPTQLQYCPSSFAQNNISRTVIRGIQLPNGHSYTFTYDSDDPAITHPFGLITKITFPTGAWVKYTWKLNTLATQGIFNDVGVQQILPACPLEYDTPAVDTRTVSFDGQNTALVQTFSYSTTWTSGSASWSTKQTTVITQDKVRLGSFETDYSYFPVTIPASPNDDFPCGGMGTCNQVPVENTITYKDWNGAILKTVTKVWQNQYLLTDETTQLGTGSSAPTSSIHYVYYPAAQGFQLQEKDEYDYGSGAKGPLSRKTLINYASFSPTPIFPTSPSIYDRPSSAQVYSPTTLAAETDYAYDQTAVSPVTAQGHDEQNFGIGFNTRANLTTQTKKCFVGSVNCTNAVSTFTYYETGQVLSGTDGCGNTVCSDMTGTNHTTTFSYSDSYDTPPASNTNAYLTKITNPLGQSSSFKYAYSDGQLIQSTDPNGQITSYFYADSLRRPTETDHPDGGKTTTIYNDAPPNPTVTSNRLLNTSNQYVTSASTMDGIGHVIKSVLTPDPDCANGDRIDTRYDGMGRVYTASNSYCSNTDPTYGITTYVYDALGRTTSVTHPDSSTILSTYTGRATQVQDEGNGTQRVIRISQTDALGRLTAMCEVAPGPFVGSGGLSSPSLVGQNGAPAACGLDISGTGFLTTYQYDALDNLKQVNQGTMAPRTFSYDSLSSLTSSANPESNTSVLPSVTTIPTVYAYDANGNLSSKTAPAPNQNGTLTVTTNYTYDALNRMTAKSYSDGTTTASTFLYDSPTGQYNISSTNPVGRLVQATSGCSFTLNRYDAVGRITFQVQQLPITCDNGYGYYRHVYNYDLMGNLTSFENGEFQIFTYGYNGVARLSSVTSSVTAGGSGRSLPTNLLSLAHYNALGGITSDTLADGESESWSYDKRGRLTSQSVTLSGATLYSLNMTSYAPNGNVLAVTDSANGNWNYSYDQFNRLVCANVASNGTCATPPAGSPTYTYVYDRFGNRWQQNGAVFNSVNFTGNNPASPANTNRVDGYSYDTAGNLTNDGTYTYTYDAENRLVSVVGGSTNSAYTYDAFGHRVKKTGNSNECGYSGPVYYLYDLADRAVVHVPSPGTNNCQDEVYAGGRHLAMYGNPGLVFVHSDWLGTERAYQNAWGGSTQTCASLPFGDNLACNFNWVGPYGTPLHFTGKERDSESGLDNFGARYNSSALGRFMSPDWSDDPSPLPNVNATNPQSLDSYSYSSNDPSNETDSDGHDALHAGTCPGLLCQLLNWLFGGGQEKENVSTQMLNWDSSSSNPDTTSSGTGGVTNLRVPGTNLTNGQFMRGGNQKLQEGAQVLQTYLDFVDPTPGGLYSAGAGYASGQRSGVDLSMAALLGTLHLHHPWPKYLGGAVDQELLPLGRQMHEEFHAGLDGIARRFKGKTYFDSLSPEARIDLFRRITTYVKDFDTKHGTQIYQAMLKNGFPLL